MQRLFMHELEKRYVQGTLPFRSPRTASGKKEGKPRVVRQGLETISQRQKNLSSESPSKIMREREQKKNKAYWQMRGRQRRNESLHHLSLEPETGNQLPPTSVCFSFKHADEILSLFVNIIQSPIFQLFFLSRFGLFVPRFMLKIGKPGVKLCGI